MCQRVFFVLPYQVFPIFLGTTEQQFTNVSGTTVLFFSVYATAQQFTNVSDTTAVCYNITVLFYIILKHKGVSPRQAAPRLRLRACP